MRKRLTSNTFLLIVAGFVMALLLVLVGVSIGLGLAYNELASTLQQTNTALNTYQLDVARGIGILMQSQCFNPTDGCCEYTDELLQNVGKATTLASCHDHLTDGMATLVESKCVVATRDCVRFAFSVARLPTKRSPLSYPLPTPTPRPLQVYVSGAVNNPDVYELPTESIVKDAIEAARGATSEADLDRVNLALSVVNGQHIYVPKQGEESPPVSPPTEPSATTSGKAGGKININTASQSEIETLPGIGPSKAQGIIENRPYGSIEETKKVPGIGEVTFQKIKDLITVD